MIKRFGGVVAVNNCSFEVEAGTIIGLIGPNGSGKTTIINIIMKTITPDAGDIRFKGISLNRLTTDKITKLGIGRTFQLVRVFGKLSVLDNLLAAHDNRSIAIDKLEFFELSDLTYENAENLSYGQKKLLSLATVLMRDPDLLLLDEPVAGVNPKLIRRITDIILELKDEGKTFLLIEHNLPFVLDISDKVVVLHQGQKIAEGLPHDIKRNEKVIDAYLGKG